MDKDKVYKLSELKKLTNDELIEAVVDLQIENAKLKVENKLLSDNVLGNNKKDIYDKYGSSKVNFAAFIFTKGKETAVAVSCIINTPKSLLLQWRKLTPSGYGDNGICGKILRQIPEVVKKVQGIYQNPGDYVTCCFEGIKSIEIEKTLNKRSKK